MKTKNMKNNWMHFTMALGLMGAMATAVHAESFSAEVPFAFEAAGKSFPAGVYTVEPVSGGVIMIHNAASGETAAMMASPMTLVEIPKPGMVFDKSTDVATLVGRESHERSVAHHCARQAAHSHADIAFEGFGGALSSVNTRR